MQPVTVPAISPSPNELPNALTQSVFVVFLSVKHVSQAPFFMLTQVTPGVTVVYAVARFAIKLPPP